MTVTLSRAAAALLVLALAAPASPLHAAAVAPPSPGAPASSQIPNLNADTLAGMHVHLPADLQGKRAVLVLAFNKGARSQVRDWGVRLDKDFSRSPDVLYFDMPVIAAVPHFLRGYVLHSMAAELSDRGKQHFLPIPDNESRWRALAGYKDPNLAYILVIDSSGQVEWQTSGPLTATAYTALREHLPAPAPTSAPPPSKSASTPAPVLP